MRGCRIVEDDAEDLLTKEVGKAVGTVFAGSILLGLGERGGWWGVVAGVGAISLNQLLIASSIEGEVFVAGVSGKLGDFLGLAVGLSCHLACDQ